MLLEHRLRRRGLTQFLTPIKMGRRVICPRKLLVRLRWRRGPPIPSFLFPNATPPSSTPTLPSARHVCRAPVASGDTHTLPPAHVGTPPTLLTQVLPASPLPLFEPPPTPSCCALWRHNRQMTPEIHNDTNAAKYSPRPPPLSSPSYPQPHPPAAHYLPTRRRLGRKCYRALFHRVDNHLCK